MLNRFMLLAVAARAACLFVCLFACAVTFANDAPKDELPAGGKPLISAASLSPEKLRVNLGGGRLGTKSIQDSGRTEFEKSIQLQLTAQPENTWDSSVSAVTTGAVKKGDAIAIGFWARGKPASGAGGGVAEVVFEKNGAPHTKSVQYLMETPDDGRWQHYWVRLQSSEDYPAGGAVVTFQTGYLRETIEFGGIEVWNFGADVELESLPYTPLTYGGREPDAAWRAAAEARIEKHRKSDVSIAVVDENGKPRSGVEVAITQTGHAFDFGTAASAEMIAGDHPQKEKYKTVLKETFNVATIENGLKWQYWDQYPTNQRRTINAVDWLNENGIPVRGHVMVWPGYRYLPDWVPALEKQPEVMSKVIDSHIREVAYAVDGKVRDWDVLNEVFDNRDLTNALGDEAMLNWFNVASAVAPGVELYYNDYAGLVRGGHPTTHKDHFEKTIRYLVDNKAPIDGIGIQGHFGSILTPPTRIISELDRWAAFDLKIQITEFDVTVPGKELQADFARDFLIACFSHPAVDSIITWGFWSEAHWEPEAALFDADWNPTLIGQQWIELTQKKWRTNETLTTDANGKVNLRAFKGAYRATIDGQTIDFEVGDEPVNVSATSGR